MHVLVYPICLIVTDGSFVTANQWITRRVTIVVFLFPGAYIARQAAKSVVASGLAKRCLVQISYAIGVAQPLSVHVDTYGTGSKPDKAILAAVLKAFDFRPGATPVFSS